MRRWVPKALIALLAVPALAAGCTATRVEADDEKGFGPEWDVVQRYGSGAADEEAPARLVPFTVEEHQTYDRVVLAYDGSRPGYRVQYGDASEETLVIALRGVRVDSGSRDAPRSPAISGIRQAPAVDGVSRTSVAVAEPGLPFRVGLGIGTFYVDIAHPGALTQQRSE